MIKKMGRPIKYTDEYIAEICDEIDKYTDQNDLPILAEFCYTHDIRKQRLYDYAGFSDAIKRLIEKKESQVEKLGLFNVVNSTMAIFSLKQIGWSDKPKEQIAEENKFAEQIKKALGSLHEDA